MQIILGTNNEYVVCLKQESQEIVCHFSKIIFIKHRGRQNLFICNTGNQPNLYTLTINTNIFWIDIVYMAKNILILGQSKQTGSFHSSGKWNAIRICLQFSHLVLKNFIYVALFEAEPLSCVFNSHWIKQTNECIGFLAHWEQRDWLKPQAPSLPEQQSSHWPPYSMFFFWPHIWLVQETSFKRSTGKEHTA